jgi:hypothetical protein
VRPSAEEIEDWARVAHEQYGVPLSFAGEVLAIGSGLSDGCILIRDTNGRRTKRPMRLMPDRFGSEPGRR